MIGPGQSRNVFKIGGVNLLYEWSQTWLNYSQSMYMCVCVYTCTDDKRNKGRTFLVPDVSPPLVPSRRRTYDLLGGKFPRRLITSVRRRFDKWTGATTTTTRHLQSGHNNSSKIPFRPTGIGTRGQRFREVPFTRRTGQRAFKSVRPRLLLVVSPCTTVHGQGVTVELALVYRLLCSIK